MARELVAAAASGSSQGLRGVGHRRSRSRSSRRTATTRRSKTNSGQTTGDTYLFAARAGCRHRRGQTAPACKARSSSPHTPASAAVAADGGGGGGGGGGTPAMTQAMFDAMMRAIGAQGPALDLPDFQGQRLAAFNAAPYTQAFGQINQAVTADTGGVAALPARKPDRRCKRNYTNAYANAPVTQAPQAQQVGTALQATAGGGGDQAAVAAQSNQAAQSDQA